MATPWRSPRKEELRLQNIGGELKKYNSFSLKVGAVVLF